jgi:hypothetical protein
MDELNKSDLRDRLGNIDQIRDILFGAQLRDYNNRLEQLESSLSILHQEIRTRTEEVKQVLSTEFQAANDALDKRLKSMALKDESEKVELRQQLESLNKRLTASADELKQDFFGDIQGAIESVDKKMRLSSQKDEEEKADLRQQLERLNARLTSNVETLDNTIDQQTVALRNDLLASREKLQQDLSTLQDRVFEEMTKRITRLGENKLGRAVLADMLFEVVLKLKETEFVPEVKAAAATDTEGGYLLAEGEEGQESPDNSDH